MQKKAINGINVVTNEKGQKTAFLIDINTIRQQKKTGSSVVKHMLKLEYIEDIIDIEASKNQTSSNWEDVKNKLKKEGKLSANVSSM